MLGRFEEVRRRVPVSRGRRVIKARGRGGEGGLSISGPMKDSLNHDDRSIYRMDR